MVLGARGCEVLLNQVLQRKRVLLSIFNSDIGCIERSIISPPVQSQSKDDQDGRANRDSLLPTLILPLQVLW